jgi:tetratricopeptide (TPR) repeat protein
MNFYKNLILCILMISFLFAGKDLESAKIRIKDKDWDQAEEYLIKALNNEKDKWEAAFHLADKIYIRKQDWGEVKKYYNIASQAPSNFKIRPTSNDRKIVISKAIDASRAKAYQIIYNKTVGFLSVINQAKSEEQKNLFIDSAIKSSVSLRDFDPSQAGGYALLAIYSSVKGDRETTLKSIEGFLNLDDITQNDRVLLLTSAAENMIRLNDFEKAIIYYEEGLSIDPNNDAIMSGIGVLYSKSGQHSKAISILEAYLENVESDQVKAEMHYNLGVSYVKIDDFENAAFHFEEAYIYNPEDEQAIFGMALAFEDAKLWRKARKYYREAQRINPTNPKYQQGISRTIIGEEQEESADG